VTILKVLAIVPFLLMSAGFLLALVCIALVPFGRRYVVRNLDAMTNSYKRLKEAQETLRNRASNYRDWLATDATKRAN
jgi:hypothetical protein